MKNLFMSIKKNKKPQLLIKICLSFLGWRIFLFIISVLADNWLTYDPSFPYASSLLANFGLPRWLYSWANFDGVHYLTIANKGYVGTGLIQAFFPLYPLLIFLGSLILKNQVMTGLLLSNLFLIGALFFGFQVVKKQFNQKTAWWWIIVTLIFPTSFYYGTLYTESLFLFLSMFSLWLWQKKKLTKSFLVAGLLSATRLVGIFHLLALITEKLNKKYFFYFALGGSGLLAFMIYLLLQFGDPLYFFHVQSEFGAGREESLILLPQVYYRYIKILITVRPFDWKYFSYVQDLLLSTSAFALLAAVYKKLPKTFLIYSIFCLLIPTLTGTFSSMPRYILVCFPLFFALADLLASSKKIYQYLYLAISLVLLIINTVLFIQGYWVA